MKEDKGFWKGRQIKLENGAVITPIIRDKESKRVDKLISFLTKARWTRCRHQDQCIDATLNYDGFSCEACPLKGNPQNVFSFNQARAAEDAFRCAELLSEAFKGGVA